MPGHFGQKPAQIRSLMDRGSTARRGSFTRIIVRGFGEAVGCSYVVPNVAAEGAVLEERAEVHDAVLGYPPSW